MNLLEEKLAKNLKQGSDYYAGVMGIGVKSLLTDEEPILVNGDEVFPIGSSIKIPVLLEFFKKAEQNKLDISKPFTYQKNQEVGGTGVLQFLTPGKVNMPLIDYATLMINLSDNTATNILIDLVGMEDVNTSLKSLGLKVTKLQRKMIDWDAAKAGKENISTPREAIHLLDCIYNKRGVSEYQRENVLNIMKKPKIGVIRNSVPDEIEIANKPGRIEGASCDVGIVLLPNQPYAVTVMTKHIPLSDFRNLITAEAMRQVTELVHTYFLETSKSTIFGLRKFI